MVGKLGYDGGGSADKAVSYVKVTLMFPFDGCRNAHTFVSFTCALSVSSCWVVRGSVCEQLDGVNR